MPYTDSSEDLSEQNTHSLNQAWVNIQISTFTNWINEKLSANGRPEIVDINEDFSSGVSLVYLVEALQGRRIGRICSKPSNQHQKLANVNSALQALTDDNMRLVNIGAQDIVDHNLKLTLGLIWSLILKYQLGKTTSSRSPPKKYILNWLRSIMPEEEINNFSSDWNDGRLLLGLLNYCKPGLCPEWYETERSQGHSNCQRAIRLAESVFNIPPIISAEDLNSPNLDELSCLTYLSYMVNENSPGSQATIDWVNRHLSSNTQVDNFTESWRDGTRLCELVSNLGGHIPEWPDNIGPLSPIDRVNKALLAARDIGLETHITARDICGKEPDHMINMTLCAQLRDMHSRPTPAKSGFHEEIITSSTVNELYLENSQRNDGHVDFLSETYEELPSMSNTNHTHAETLSSAPACFWLESKPQVNCECQLTVDLSRMPSGTYKMDKQSEPNIQVYVTLMDESNSPVREMTVSSRPDAKSRMRRMATFVPDKPGTYKAEAFVDNHAVLGSPFFITVSGEDGVNHQSNHMLASSLYAAGTCLSYGRVRVGHQHQFVISGDNLLQSMDIDLFDISLFDSNSMQPVEVILRKQSNGEFVGEFNPTFIATLTLALNYDCQPIGDSPYNIVVFDPESIKITLQKEVKVNEDAIIQVNYGDAGPVSMTVFSTIDKESQVAVHLKSSTLTTQTFSYKPSYPGEYLIYVYTVAGDVEVPGCPAKQTAVWSKASRNSEVFLKVFGEGLIKARVGETASFRVDPGEQGELYVQVDGPTTIAKCDITPEENGLWIVHYIPNEPGHYKIHIKWNNVTIKGSPFHATVVNTKKIRCISDEGLFSGEPVSLVVNDQKEIIFDTRLAGPGHLRAEVIASSRKADRITCTAQPTAMPAEWIVKFTPVTVGEHKLFLYWEDFQIERSPFRAEATAPIMDLDHNKVILSGRGLREATVNEESEFLVDGRQAGPGRPLVTLSSVKSSVEVHVLPLSGDRYRCVYTPQFPGAYLMNIMWSEYQVKGSPFKVNVLNQSEASRVVCTGEGLSHGVYGQNISCKIDTRMAGPGELTAHCAGPNKVAYCELSDHLDGTFTLKLNPQESGRHILQICYNGKHAPGSPFTVRVSGAPDASKVKVWGPGVEPGVLSSFQSRFVCETRGAGAGQLTVRIKGKQGAFRVEMERETLSERTIVCRYDPTESGEYIIYVKWSGVNVQGSPFVVPIFDSIYELQRYVKENPEKVPMSMKQKSWQAEL